MAQQKSGLIKTIFVSMILLVVMGWVVNTVVVAIPHNYTQHDNALTDTTFNENLENADSPWTIASTDNHPIKWDGTNEIAYITGVTADNSTLESSDNITQSITIPSYDKFVSANASWAWQIKDNENITDLDIYVELQDPDGNWSTVWQQTDHMVKDPSYRTNDNNLENVIDASGEWALRLRTHIKTDDNDSAQVNYDNVEFTTSVKTEGTTLGVFKAVTTYGPTIVNILFIGLFILGVAALINYLRL